MLVRSWPTAAGALRMSEIEERQARGGMLYALVVTYSYQAGGATQQGQRLAFGPRWMKGQDLIE